MIVKIGFAKNKKWWAIFSWIIRLVDLKKASHCYLELVTDNGPWIVESVYPRGRILPKTKWLETYEVVKEFEFGTSHDPSTVFAWAEFMVKDKQYSLFQNILIGLTIVFNNALNKLEFVEVNGRKRQNCTEVVTYFMEDWLDLDWEQSLDNVSLTEVYAIAERLSWEKNNGSISNT